MPERDDLDNEHSVYAAYLRGERLLHPGLLLLLARHPMHGYELIQSLNQLSFTSEECDPATVYRNLRRMEEDGLVHSEWQAGESGPARRVYYLTANGEHLLEMMAANAQRRREQLEAFLRLFTVIHSAGSIPAENLRKEAEGEKSESQKEALHILHAGALRGPLKECARVFQEAHPGTVLTLQAAGSRECARRLRRGEQADVIALADPAVFTELLEPEIVSRCFVFATDRIVLAFEEYSRGRDSLTEHNWMDILLMNQVTYARSDENLDPCGYRTLMVWQLAEDFYHRPGLYDRLCARCPRERIAPKSIDLVELLIQGRVDYVFVYSSVAAQFGLQHLTLPREIDLSSPAFAQRYNAATVTVEGRQPGETVTLRGAPIEFAIGIHRQTRHPGPAQAFLDFVHGRAGQAILESYGLIPC
ncbi:MAG: substrate-binding domain-containing protein [Bacillota bacterium]|nr:substrate-binding domain-containing protein [Thermoanaerobacteraceae bacterium]